MPKLAPPAARLVAAGLALAGDGAQAGRRRELGCELGAQPLRLHAVVVQGTAERGLDPSLQIAPA